MSSMVTIVNETVLLIWKLLTVSLESSQSKNIFENMYGVKYLLSYFGDILQYIQVSNLYCTLETNLMLKWSEVSQSCPTLCDPIDCSLSGSSVHGIFQARVLEWIAISFSRGSSRPRNRIRVSHIAGRCLTVWATREACLLYHNKKWLWCKRWNEKKERDIQTQRHMHLIEVRHRM